LNEQFFDLVVIGTGAGLMVAEAAQQRGLTVAVVEKGKFGGTCLTRGCIPSKMMVYPADLLRETQRAHKVGITYEKPTVDWQAISRNVWKQIDFSKKIEESFDHLDNLTTFKGVGAFTGPHTMVVRLNAGGEAHIRGERFVIATGAATRIPPVEGLEQTGYLTSESFFGKDYPDKPWDSLIIAGGGIIAAEFAHIFSAMGTKVTVVGRNRRLLPMEDPEISDMVRWQFGQYGIDVLTGYEVIKAERTPQGKRLTARSQDGGEPISVTAQQILIATGVGPVTKALQPDKAGVQTDAQGYVKVDEYLQTSQPHIYALGDVLGGYLFRHKANYEADLLIHNLFDTNSPPRRADYRAIPWAVFTAPQIGHVGMTEEEVRRLGRPYYVGRYRYANIAAGMAMGYRHKDGDNGLVKLLLDEKRRILGVHIAGFQAAALVQPFVYLMNAGGNLGEDMAGSILPLMRSMVIHPTLSELAAWSLETIDWDNPIDPAKPREVTG
jgi:mycothione reductase